MSAASASRWLSRSGSITGPTTAAKARYGFRLCLARPPSDKELDDLLKLYEKTRQRFAGESDKARDVATKPLGDAPEGLEVTELAAWTVVGNVLLNLDETLMKR